MWTDAYSLFYLISIVFIIIPFFNYMGGATISRPQQVHMTDGKNTQLGVDSSNVKFSQFCSKFSPVPKWLNLITIWNNNGSLSKI